MADEARSTLEGAILIVELLRRSPRRGFTTSRLLQAAQTTGNTAPTTVQATPPLPSQHQER
jgi:hypothetical protein